MLRKFHIARLALQHSPETEQRLLSFAFGAPPAQDGTQEPPEGETVAEQLTSEQISNAANALESGDVTLSSRQEFHDAIFNAIHADDQRRVLDAFRPEIERHLGTVETPASDRDLDEVLQLTRLSIVDELNREQRERVVLADALKSIDTTTSTDEQINTVFRDHATIIDRYFRIAPSMDKRMAVDLLQAMLLKDIERIRAREYERETGIKWTFLKANQFEEIYRKFQGATSDDARIPRAFVRGNVMYFNTEHEDFRDPENGELNARRAVTHETTHLAISAAERKFDLEAWTNNLRSHPDWEKLKSAVEAVFGADPMYLKGKGRLNEVIVDEALAIYVTELRHPRSNNAESGLAQAQRNVYDVMKAIFDSQNTGFLQMLRNDLETRIDRFLEVKTRSAEGRKDVGTLLVESSKETAAQRRIGERAESQRIIDAAGNEVRTDPDAAKKKAKDDLEEAKKSVADTSPATLLELRKKVGTSLGELAETYPSMRQKIEAEATEKSVKEEALAALDQNLEWISAHQNDMTLIERAVTRIADAEGKLTAGGDELTVGQKQRLHEDCLPDVPNPYQYLTDDSAPEEIAAADEKFKANRQEMLSIAHDVLTQTERIADRIKQGANLEEETGGTPQAEEGGIMNWFRKNVWGPDSGIIWVTPLNIMNIIKTYKEAIAENYRSNQTVKENRLAKELNFYKPIQHTLNKQARSSNEKETSEFKEYIEREGFTFSDVFGPDGRGLSAGLLYENRHNFNRAKAVLLYAADHAWLYFMDRLHGHDVYGIDYEGIEGHQSFEELVGQNEAGKSHQIDHGRERVDKDPDVEPIMHAMVHELRLKNIFAVQGIMKRLQEKAKYSHSNTWMLTTLLMLIRDESKKDPTLKLCLDKGMIDNISNFTITQSSWSITWLKLNRHEIEKWKLGKEEFGNNKTTKAMEKIEEKLKEAGCKFPDTDKGNMAKYEAIAMVMAGKTFSADNGEARSRGLLNYGIPSKAISIFEDDAEFNDYRAAFRNTTASTDTEPGDTDSDYFNPGNGGSDIMLLDQSQTSRILGRKSTGEWTYDSKARGYITQILIRYDELEKANPGAFQNFKEEIRKKMSYCVLGVWDKGRLPIVATDSDLQDNNMLDQLASRGLFTDDKLKVLEEFRKGIRSAQRIPMKPM